MYVRHIQKGYQTVPCSLIQTLLLSQSIIRGDLSEAIFYLWFENDYAVVGCKTKLFLVNMI